jgi:hypothetical protein
MLLWERFKGKNVTEISYLKVATDIVQKWRFENLMSLKSVIVLF